MSDTPVAAEHRRASKAPASGEPFELALPIPAEAQAAREEAMRDSAFWMEGVIRISEPMRIGKHEWRLVLYRGTSLHYVGAQGDDAAVQGRWVERPCRCVGYEWRRTSDPERWRRETEWPRYDINDGQFLGLPRRLRALWERCPWAHDVRGDGEGAA